MIQQTINLTEEIIKRTLEAANFQRLSQEDKTKANRLMKDLIKYSEQLSCYPQNINENYLSEKDLEKMNKYYIWFENGVSCC